MSKVASKIEAKDYSISYVLSNKKYNTACPLFRFRSMQLLRRR